MQYILFPCNAVKASSGYWKVFVDIGRRDLLRVVIVLLNISPNNTQTTGPQENPKQNTYKLAAIRANEEFQ